MLPRSECSSHLCVKCGDLSDPSGKCYSSQKDSGSQCHQDLVLKIVSTQVSPDARTRWIGQKRGDPHSNDGWSFSRTYNATAVERTCMALTYTTRIIGEPLEQYTALVTSSSLKDTVQGSRSMVMNNQSLYQPSTTLLRSFTLRLLAIPIYSINVWGGSCWWKHKTHHQEPCHLLVSLNGLPWLIHM